MCGVVGILAKRTVNQDIFDALTTLQHRGQDAAGIATCNDEGRVFIKKGSGLVRDVIRTSQMRYLQGAMGIGQLRYPIAADNDNDEEAQPFYVNSPYGITLAYHGNLSNRQALIQDLLYNDRRHLRTDSDAEIVLNVFAHALQNLGKVHLDQQDIFQAVATVHQRCRGAYAVVAMIAGVGIVAFRDPYGIRPLVYGHRKTATGPETMAASESVALDVLGYQEITDVAPGEAIFIQVNGQFFKHLCAEQTGYAPCLFEYACLARADSIIEQVLVYKVRLRLGEMLARKITRQWPNHDIDVVMPIPDTSRTAAAELARRLGLKFREGFVKNRYIGRTFMMPGQPLRKRSVRQKLNPIPLEFNDKNVLLVIDSLIRGNTAKEIIQMAREAGANNVYFVVTTPEVRYPNVYGIDMPAVSELIAHNRTTEEIRVALGADGLIYQDLTVLTDAVREGNPSLQQFEDTMFTGRYVTGDIDSAYLEELERTRQGKTQRTAIEEA